MRSSLSVAGGGERNAGICEIGKVYGPFRIKRVLGEGGTAVVYLAEHLSLRGEVALKVLRPQFLLMPDFLERFRGEGRALWELQHPNVVRVLHADDHEDLGPYMSMEVLKGKSLAQMLSRARLPTALALSILMKLATSDPAVSRARLRGPRAYRRPSSTPLATAEDVVLQALVADRRRPSREPLTVRDGHSRFPLGGSSVFRRPAR